MTPVANNNLTAITTTQIVSTYDFFRPNMRKEAIAKYNKQGADYMQIMIDMAMVENVDREVVTHWEDLPYHSLVKVNAPVTPAAGADLSFVLHPDSVPTIPNSKPYVRPGDILMLVKNERVGRVESVTFGGGNWTVVVRPNVSTDQLSVVANDEFAIISSSFAEGTGQPESTSTGMVKYDAYLQIIKETAAATGTLLTEALWFTSHQNAGATPTYWSPLIAQLDYKVNLKQEGAFLFNKQNTNAAATAANTNGLIPAMKSARGFQFPTGGAIVLTDVDSWNDRLNKVFAKNNICGLTTHKRITELEAELVQDMQNTNIIQAKEQIMHAIKSNGALEDAQKSFEVNYQFNAVRKGGRNFSWARLASLDNPVTYNAAASSQQDYMVLFPVDKGTDAKGYLRNHVSLLKKNHNGYNRFMETWYDGAAGGTGTYIGDVDVKKFYVRSHCGTRHFALEQSILVTA